jgi:ParB family chromosome partitioning protein
MERTSPRPVVTGPLPELVLADEPADESRSPAGLPRIKVFDIDKNPFQPRRDFDVAEIESLAESLAEHGMLQPVVVRRVGDRFQLVAGERRLRAAIQAGWTDLPAQVLELDDRQAAEIAIVENLARKDLNALEKAASFQQYLDSYGCTQEELAKRLQLDRSTIANLIRLLELPEGVQRAVREGRITQGHARALLPLGDECEQLEFCRKIQGEELSVRATEDLVNEAIRQADAEPLDVLPLPGGAKAKPARKRTQSQQIASLQQEFRAALGARVDLKPGPNGRGKIVIHFTSHEEFERLRSQFAGASVHSYSRSG